MINNLIIIIYNDDDNDGQVDDPGDTRVPNVLCSFYTDHFTLVKAELTSDSGTCTYQADPDFFPITVKFSRLPDNKKVILPQGKLVVEAGDVPVSLDVLIADKCVDFLDCLFYYTIGWILEFLDGLF